MADISSFVFDINTTVKLHKPEPTHIDFEDVSNGTEN